MVEDLANVFWYLLFIPIAAIVVVGMCALIVALVLTSND